MNIQKKTLLTIAAASLALTACGAADPLTQTEVGDYLAHANMCNVRSGHLQTHMAEEDIDALTMFEKAKTVANTCYGGTVNRSSPADAESAMLDKCNGMMRHSGRVGKLAADILEGDTDLEKQSQLRYSMEQVVPATEQCQVVFDAFLEDRPDLDKDELPYLFGRGSRAYDAAMNQ